MRMYPFLLVTAVTISAYTDATSTRPRSTFERSAPIPQQAVQRLLQDGAETSKEERMFNMKIPFISKPLDASMENFKHLLPQFSHDMPMNKQFMSFWKKVTSKHKEKEILVASFLAQHYGVNNFLTMLEKFKADEAMKKLATELEEWWIKSRIEETGTPSNDDIMGVLKLIHLDNNVLSSSRFTSYFNLMNKKYATNEGDLYQAMAKELDYRFGSSDAFLKMLTTVKQSAKDRDTTDLATKLQDGWIRSKVNGEEVPSNEVINHVLRLMHYDAKMLSSQRFDWYHRLMQKIYPEDEDDLYLAMAIELGSRYNTDDAFVGMLKAAIQSPKDISMKDLATKLLDRWKFFRDESSGKDLNELSDRVLKLIRLDDNVLSSPFFKVYHEVMKKAFATKPDDLYPRMAYGLASRFELDMLPFLKMLEKFEMNPATKEIATSLYNGFVAFARDVSITPTTVLDDLLVKYLKNKIGADIIGRTINMLNSSDFKVWLRYALKVNADSKDEALSIVATVLAKRHKDKESVLASLKYALMGEDTKVALIAKVNKLTESDF